MMRLVYQGDNEAVAVAVANESNDKNQKLLFNTQCMPLEDATQVNKQFHF